MYGYIYITTNLINNKKYIGQRRLANATIETALADPYLGSGRDLLKAINKYSIVNFTKDILELCENKEVLNEREIYWIDKYNAVKDKNFYNLAYGGSGGDTFSGLSKEDQNICRMRNRLHNAGRTLPEDQKRNISESLKNKKKSLEHLINEAKTFADKGWVTIYSFTDILCFKDLEKTQLVDIFQKDSFCKQFKINPEYPGWCSGIKKSIKNKTLYNGFYWDIDLSYTTAKFFSPKYGYEKDGEIFGPFYGTKEMALHAIGSWSAVICTAINRVIKKERDHYHNIIFFIYKDEESM